MGCRASSEKSEKSDSQPASSDVQVLTGLMHSLIREKEEDVMKKAVRDKESVISSVIYGFDNDHNFYINIKCAATADFIYRIVIDLKYPKCITWKEVRCIRGAVKFAERGSKFNKAAFEAWLGKANEFGNAVSEDTNNAIIITIRPKQGRGNFKGGHIQKTSLLFVDGKAIVSFSTDVEKYKICVDHINVNESFGKMQIDAFADAIHVAETGDKMDDSIFKHFAAQLKEKYHFVSMSGSSGNLELLMRPHPVTPEQCGIEFPSSVTIPPKKSGNGSWSEETAARVKQLAEVPYHHGIICDGCGKEGAGFTGLRFKCEVCDDLDLCQSCFDDAPEVRGHLSSHSMKRMDAPEDSLTKKDDSSSDLLTQLLTALAGEMTPLQKERLTEENVYANADLEEGSAVITKWVYEIDRKQNFVMTLTTTKPEKTIILVAVLQDPNNVTAKEAEVIKFFFKMGERGTALSITTLKGLAVVMKQIFDDVNYQELGEKSLILVTAGGSNKDIKPGHINRLQIGVDSDKDFVLKFHTDVKEYAIIVNHNIQADSISKHQGKALNDAMKICEPGMKMDDSMFMFYAAQLREKYNLMRVTRAGGMLVGYIVPTQLSAADAGTTIEKEGDLTIPAPVSGTADWSAETKRRLQSLGSSSRDSKDSKCHLNIQCNGCNEMNFTTKRFKCQECENFNLCRSCYDGDFEGGGHLASHECAVSVPKDPIPQEAKSGEELVEIDNGRIVATNLLKKSGQATVYKGYMKEAEGTRKDVCIKLYHKKDDWNELMKEAMAIVQIPRHENVITVLSFFPEPLPNLIMPLIEGSDLFDLLSKKKGALPRDVAATVLQGIGQGLSHLHSRGIIHRDLKSPNVMVEAGTNRAVLIDLGLGKVTDRNTMQETACAKGSLLWMAPEMMRSSVYNFKSDMYAVGIMMWEIFSGKVPYHHIDALRLVWHVAKDKGRPLLEDATKNEGVTTTMSELMQSCWNDDADLRPTADEFVGRLTDALSERAV